VNPKAKPVTPKTSKGCERDLTRFLLVYQAAVEDDQNRFATRDHEIQPFGTEYAAEICGRTTNYMRNTLNPFNELNPAGLKEFYRLLHNGIDRSVLNELVRPLPAVVLYLPDSDEQSSPVEMAAHGVKLAKEVGDVFACMEKVFRDDSEGGRAVTANECDQFERECMEVIPKLMVLIDDMRRAAACR